MYKPPEEYDSDSDDYDGFSFGSEFRDEKISNQKYNGYQINEEDLRDDKLYAVIENGNSTDLFRLLDEVKSSDFNIDSAIKQGCTLLLHACTKRKYELVTTLISQGANVNIAVASKTPLMAACQNPENSVETLNIVKLLIDNGAVINVSDRCGITPFMYACMNGHESIVKILLKSASLEASDNQGYTALFHAVENNHIEIASLLINSGVYINITNFAGYSPKQIALFRNFHKIAILFPSEEEYQIPTTYLCYNHYADLAPTVFKNDRMPAYFQDIGNLLTGMESEKFLPNFAKAGLNLLEFLNISEERLIELGVKYPFQRKRIYFGLWKFHRHPWSPWSITRVGLKENNNMYDLFLVFAATLKHIIIANTSIKYVHNQLYTLNLGTITEDVKIHIQNITKLITEMKTVVNSIKARIVYLEKLSSPKPPLFICPDKCQKSSRSKFTWPLFKVSAIAAICFLLYRKLR